MMRNLKEYANIFGWMNMSRITLTFHLGENKIKVTFYYTWVYDILHFLGVRK